KVSLLLAREGRPFQYALVDPVLIRHHRIDRDAAGHIAQPEQATNSYTRERHIVRSLVGASLQSSQLEGDAQTRQVARERFREGRPPRDRSERMILNNYRAMQHIRERLDEPMTPDLVYDIHRTVSEGTLDSEEGPLRSPGDGVVIYDDRNQLLHRPPPAEEIEVR